MTRPGWHEYFLGIAENVSLRADCTRRRVGAVVVSPDRRILGTGYNGTRAGRKGCLEGACPRGRLSYAEVAEFTNYDDFDSPGYCISTHAEINAMLFAGTSVVGSTVYITDHPCPGCRKVLENSGVARVVTPGGVIVCGE